MFFKNFLILIFGKLLLRRWDHFLTLYISPFIFIWRLFGRNSLFSQTLALSTSSKSIPRSNLSSSVLYSTPLPFVRGIVVIRLSRSQFAFLSNFNFFFFFKFSDRMWSYLFARIMQLTMDGVSSKAPESSYSCARCGNPSHLQ